MAARAAAKIASSAAISSRARLRRRVAAALARRAAGDASARARARSSRRVFRQWTSKIGKEIEMKQQRWQDWVMLALGAWVFFSPFWMAGYASMGDAAAWNSYILGALAAMFACAALATGKIWEERLNAALGIWLLIAPFVLGFHAAEPGASWNHFVLGALMVIDAAWALGAARSQGALPRGSH
jgi:hypothetical protein